MQQKTQTPMTKESRAAKVSKRKHNDNHLQVKKNRPYLDSNRIRRNRKNTYASAPLLAPARSAC